MIDPRPPDQRRAKKLFNESLGAIQKILPDIKESRWGNKADFYTLFITLASLLRLEELPESKIPGVREALGELATEVDLRLADEEARVSKNATDYVRAVERGVNDKKRRANRQAALLNVVRPYFEEDKPTSVDTQTETVSSV